MELGSCRGSAASCKCGEATVTSAGVGGSAGELGESVARRKALRKARNRRHYEKVDAAKKKARYEEFRLFIDGVKLERGCVDCGYDVNPAALDFDHRDPSAKKLNVSTMFSYGRQQQLAELAKCDVRCAICHRIKTLEAKESGKRGPATWNRSGEAVG